MAEEGEGPKLFAPDSRDDEVRRIRLATAGVKRRLAMFSSAAAIHAKDGGPHSPDHFSDASAGASKDAQGIIRDVNTKK